MSSLADWLARRAPEPPAELAGRVHDAASSPPIEASPEGLAGLARESLTAARATPGRVRDSAFHLLVADALVTYACEAALESDEAALADVLEVISRP